jgi:hypothetical protein
MIKLTNLEGNPVYLFEPITALIEFELMTVVYTESNEFEVKESFNDIFLSQNKHLFN